MFVDVYPQKIFNIIFKDWDDSKTVQTLDFVKFIVIENVHLISGQLN